MPDYKMESDFAGVVAGVDEAGRGPWAGPVVAAAVILDADRIPAGINDSKKLSRKRRETLAPLIRDAAKVGVGQASVEEIDDINILAATMLAMTRAVQALKPKPQMILVDGNRLPDWRYASKAVIKGDTLSLSIAAASIIAKVTRDQIMADLAANHPGFGWETNAGYGTKQHHRALLQNGITPHHRRSFAPIRNMLSQDSYLTP